MTVTQRGGLAQNAEVPGSDITGLAGGEEHVRGWDRSRHQRGDAPLMSPLETTQQSVRVQIPHQDGAIAGAGVEVGGGDGQGGDRGGVAAEALHSQRHDGTVTVAYSKCMTMHVIIAAVKQ